MYRLTLSTKRQSSLQILISADLISFHENYCVKNNVKWILFIGFEPKIPSDCLRVSASVMDINGPSALGTTTFPRSSRRWQAVHPASSSPEYGMPVTGLDVGRLSI